MANFGNSGIIFIQDFEFPNKDGIIDQNVKFGEIELALFNLFIFGPEITKVFLQIINSDESVIYIF
jgi:hypothetical protein